MARCRTCSSGKSPTFSNASILLPWRHRRARSIARLAAAKLYPPAGFDIENAAIAALRKQDEELSRTNPKLAAWVRIREKLESPEGDKYFADNFQDKPLTGLKGTLIKAEPADRPKELTIGMIDPTQPEIVLKLDTPFPNAAQPGAVLRI